MSSSGTSLAAEDYEKILRKGYTSEEIIGGLKEISDLLDHRMEVLVIGEAPIVLRTWKKICSEIELVFMKQGDLDSFIEALSKAGYEETLYMRYKKYLAFDLYLRFFSEFAVSDEMIRRAFETDLGNLVVKIASPEDIILLKSSSTRDSDYMDIRLLLNKIKPDWNSIISELDTQVNELGASDYSGIMLLATVNDLRRRKYQIPDDARKEIVRTIEK
jgi:hypothetical protein